MRELKNLRMNQRTSGPTRVICETLLEVIAQIFTLDTETVHFLYPGVFCRLVALADKYCATAPDCGAQPSDNGAENVWEMQGRILGKMS